MNQNEIHVGIGFATGRKCFQKVLRSYVYNLNDSKFVKKEHIHFHLIVAYDLAYKKTRKRDYTKLSPDIVQQIDSSTFISKASIKQEINELIEEGIISEKEGELAFGKGYGASRNAVLYNAVKQNLDYLIFLDDDEYPVAVTKNGKNPVWGGQNVLTAHLNFIEEADITHGHHCGYISPIPYVEYNDTMSEDDFRIFIEAVSNDILSWEKVKGVMENGGVTYADTGILNSDEALEVEEAGQAKFISGANLCLNLRDPLRLFPFYNPPGARGEDTFLSTCLTNRRVLRIPCYAFHDGFSTYHQLFEGILPIQLKFIRADGEQVTSRFYRACIGWIRYKPLLIHITQPDQYEEKIDLIRQQLNQTLPRLCEFFQDPDFINILTEFEKYHRNVKKHHKEFLESQKIWSKMMMDLKKRKKAVL